MSTGTRSRDRQARLLNFAGNAPLSGALSRLHATVYRISGGRLMKRWFGTPVLSLQVHGRKSGKLYSLPLVYATHRNGWLVVAANGGARKAPQWADNLRAAEEATVHVGGKAYEVTPHFPVGDEEKELRAEYEKTYPTVKDYERFTTRRFPIVLLKRK